MDAHGCGSIGSIHHCHIFTYAAFAWSGTKMMHPIPTNMMVDRKLTMVFICIFLTPAVIGKRGFFYDYLMITYNVNFYQGGDIKSSAPPMAF